MGEKVGVKEDFVRKYGLSAMIIEEACDFPAVILLVVSALETGWGRRVVDNNLLGIKKLDLIPGHVIIQTKEYENGEMVKKEERFQSFQDPRSQWSAMSQRSAKKQDTRKPGKKDTAHSFSFLRLQMQDMPQIRCMHGNWKTY